MKTCFPVLLITLLAGSLRAGDPLPAWHDNSTKEAITAFVEKVTASDSSDYVPPAERIAVFDNDGCLWAEQPVYFQALYTFDRVRALASGFPEWEKQEPFASVLRGDLKAALAGGEKSLLAMVGATHGGLSSEAFAASVNEWLATARHPTTGMAYTSMVYQPMLELLEFLRSKQFKTYIVSGGGIDFIRPWAERVYGIPPEQIVGSSLELAYEQRDGKPVMVKLPHLHFIDDKAGKPVGIERHLGRRPLFAAGNSDGDFEMLEWTTSGPGVRLGMLIHHDDAEREFAYDRSSQVGRLARGLDEAPARGWVIASMLNDWKTIYPPAPQH